MTAVDEEEGFEEQAGDGDREDDFFDKTEFSDDKVDDGWESGLRVDGPSNGLSPTSTDSDLVF